MIDITSDPAIEIARTVRECEARVVSKLQRLQLGEAWRDLDTAPS